MSQRSVVAGAVIGIIGLMTIAGLLLAVLRTADGGGGVGLGSRIAVLEIDGLIADDEDLLRQIREYRRDASVKGFLLDINSPGGVVAPSQSVYEEIRRLRERDERPVIASIGGVGASGGYYIALAADSIFALPGSITGSIGVIMEFPDASELMEKVGVEMQVIKSSELKDAGSPFRPMSPEDSAAMAAVVTDVYRQFVEAVASERSLPLEAAERLGDGRVFSGRQALEHGLIDRIGNFNDALAAAGRMAGLGDEPRFTRPPEDEFSLLGLLFGRSAAAALSRVARPLEGAGGPTIQYVPF